MNDIKKGDFIVVTREFAESVIDEYGRVPMKSKCAVAVARQDGVDKKMEANTLLYVCDRTDGSITLAVPMFEGLEKDSFLLLCDGTTNIDAFEDSAYVKITDKMPFGRLHKLYAAPEVSAIQLSRPLLYIFIASGLAALLVTACILKMDPESVLIYLAVTMVASGAILSVIQRAVIFTNYIDREYNRITGPFFELQKRYNFFYYKKGTDNGLPRRFFNETNS